MERGSQYSHKREHSVIAPHPESAALRALLLPGMCSGSGIPGSSDIPAEGTEAAAIQQSTCQVPRTILQVGKNLSLNVEMCWMQLQLRGHASLVPGAGAAEKATAQQLLQLIPAGKNAVKQTGKWISWEQNFPMTLGLYQKLPHL